MTQDKDTMTRRNTAISMTRRQALTGLLALVGSTISAAELDSLADAAMSDSASSPRFLDSDRFALLGRVVDLMIPETDTPGAYEVGVHRFIDLMLADYAARASQDQLLDGLAVISEAAESRLGNPFVELSSEQQFDVLAAVDGEAFADQDSSEAYRMLKSMILFGYYTSEIGASVELRFNPYPGTTPGCVPADTFDRAPYRSL